MATRHRGLTIVQSEYNNHCIIFDENEKLICCISCSEKLDEEGLKKKIDDFIEFRERFNEK